MGSLCGATVFFGWKKETLAECRSLPTEQHMRLLRNRRNNAIDPGRHVNALHPEHLLCQDTCLVGIITGGGKVYIPVLNDLRLARLPQALPCPPQITDADLLQDRVQPAYNGHSVVIEHLVASNAGGFSDRELRHHFEILTALEQIANRRTQAQSPETS